MSMTRHVGFWIALLVACALGLWLVRGILLPFIAGLMLAYLLDPLADRFERLGIGRLGASLLILLLAAVIFGLVGLLILPVVSRQLTLFSTHVPEYVAAVQRLLAERVGPMVERLGGRDAITDLQSSIGDFVGQGTSWAIGVLKSLWSGSQAIVNLVSVVIVTPVVAFYMLLDWDRMVATVDGWIPPRHRPTARMLARDIDRAIAGFIRGQAAVCLLLGTFYAIGLSLVGLNFAILIGAASGLLTFIPYVGSFTGLVLSVGVALVQFWPDWSMVLLTLGVFVVGQFLEGNVVSPKLVGEAVGLHPVWLMFALLAFGSLFGFAGLLIAVPVAATLGVLARFALGRYLASPLYEEGAPALPRPENDA